MTYRKIYLNEVEGTVALDLSKSGAVVVVVEHQGRDAQHHMISASYLQVCQLWRFWGAPKIGTSRQTCHTSWFETWDPSEYFSISNMIQMSNFTNDMGKFPTHHSTSSQLQRTISWTKSNPTVVLAPHSRADCLAWNESATRPPGCHTCHASVERFDGRNPEASIWHGTYQYPMNYRASFMSGGVGFHQQYWSLHQSQVVSKLKQH